MRRISTVRFAAVVAPLVAGALLAGCGGSSPGPSAAAKERSQEAHEEAKLAEFAKCMREHGVDAKVRSSPGEGQGLEVRPGREGAGNPETAEKACARYRPEPRHVDLSPQQQVEREEAVQRFAKCMREHGIEVEASAKGGAIQVNVHRNGAPNPRSPAFQRAQATCQKLLPGGPGHHRSPGAPGGPEASRPGG